MIACLVRLIPRRPEPTDPRARRVVEWAEVIYYVFVLSMAEITIALGVVLHAPALLK